MKLLANENFPLTSVNYLKDEGFDILSIGADNQGISDEQVMAIAIREERTIITFDSDYGELIFKYNYQPSAGVIYLRFIPKSPVESGQFIQKLINSRKLSFRRTLTVVDIDGGIRQRKY